MVALRGFTQVGVAVSPDAVAGFSLLCAGKCLTASCQ